MLKFLIRCVFFIAGVALILDVLLPIRTEQLRVDQHTSQTQTDQRSTRSGDGRWADTSYKIHLIGGTLSSCSVGYSVYAMLRDGDSIEVQSTKIFQMCTRIMREGEQIDHYKHWKWFALLGGAMLIAVGIGWLKGDDDGDNNGISIRFG